MLNTAFEPVNVSVPAPMLVRYWLVGSPWLLVRYEMKFFRSPLKLDCALDATKLKTVCTPLLPLYSFQLTPPIVGVAIVLPVEEMGPAPPSALSQIMISYCEVPLAEDPVKRSYATLATTDVPV